MHQLLAVVLLLLLRSDPDLQGVGLHQDDAGRVFCQRRPERGVQDPGEYGCRAPE